MDGNTNIQVPTGAGDLPPANTADTGSASFIDTVPESYRDKPYLQDILKAENPREALFQQFDNAQQLIGKKSEGIKVPGEGATAEDWKAFNQAIGVPESVDAFKFEGPVVEGESAEQIQAVLKDLQSDDLVSALKTTALEAGLRPQQFDALAKTYSDFLLKEAQAQLNVGAEQQQQKEAKFQESFKNVFKDRADHVFARGKEIAQQAIPEGARAHGDPELFLYQVLDWVDQNFLKESQVNTTGGKLTTSSPDNLRAEINKLRASDAYQSKFHPDNPSVVKQVDELYERWVSAKK